MVEVTQEDRIAAAAYMKRIDDNRWSQHGILSGGCDNCSVTQAFAAHRQAAFNAGRASVLAELESPTEAMVNSCMGNNGIGPLTAATVWKAMIGAYKEAL